MGRRDDWPVPLALAAEIACQQLGGCRNAEALNAAAEALSRLLPIYQEIGGRLFELPLEHRALGEFRGGASHFIARGALYRRLYVRRPDLENALAVLANGGAALPPVLSEHRYPGDQRIRRP
jgi:hypothetical protein